MVNSFSFHKYDKISSDLSYEMLYFYLRRKTVRWGKRGRLFTNTISHRDYAKQKLLISNHILQKTICVIIYLCPYFGSNVSENGSWCGCTSPHHLNNWLWPHTLQWRYNGRDGVTNHQPPHCLLSRLFGRRSKKTSKLRVTGLENIYFWWRHHEYAEKLPDAVHIISISINDLQMKE